MPPTMEQSRIGTLAMQVNLWASLGYGLMLLLVPDVFCDLLKAEAVNTAWLRTIGAALLVCPRSWLSASIRSPQPQWRRWRWREISAKPSMASSSCG